MSKGRTYKLTSPEIEDSIWIAFQPLSLKTGRHEFKVYLDQVKLTDEEMRSRAEKKAAKLRKIEEEKERRVKDLEEAKIEYDAQRLDWLKKQAIIPKEEETRDMGGSTKEQF